MSLWSELRYAFRSLAKSPVFASVAVVSMALGIGANTAVFSVVNSILIKPLPYPGSERLVALWLAAPGAGGLAANVVAFALFA